MTAPRINVAIRLIALTILEEEDMDPTLSHIQTYTSSPAVAAALVDSLSPSSSPHSSSSNGNGSTNKHESGTLSQNNSSTGPSLEIPALNAVNASILAKYQKDQVTNTALLLVLRLLKHMAELKIVIDGSTQGQLVSLLTRTGHIHDALALMSARLSNSITHLTHKRTDDCKYTFQI